MNKISLEKFREIKNEIISFLEMAGETISALEAGEIKSFYPLTPEALNKINEQLTRYKNLGIKNEEDLIDYCFKMQNKFLEFDLSDIPFDEWKDFVIISDQNHKVDFSKTGANIDFNLVECEGYCNFKGCNVKNLEKLKKLNPKDFDEKTISANPSLFLSNNFSEDFKEKYYDNSLKISDLATLSNEQLDEISKKDLFWHMVGGEYNYVLINTLGLDKVINLYKYSIEDYNAVNGLINQNSEYRYGFDKIDNLPTFKEFLEQIKSIEVSELKETCFDFERKQIINTSMRINQKDYPESFIKENPDIFLVNVEIPDEVKQKYFNKHLSIKDLLDYSDVFSNIPIDFFMDYSPNIPEKIRKKYGMGEFQKLVSEYPDIFNHLLQSNDSYFLYRFSQILDSTNTFKSAVRDYFLAYEMSEQFRVVNEGQISYDVPEWLSAMNFKFIEQIKTNDDLLNIDDSTVILDDDQRRVLNFLGIENIKKFEQETGFFTHKSYEWSQDLEMFNALRSYFKHYHYRSSSNFDFKNGSLNYEEFLQQFAKCLDFMRQYNVFTDFPDYDWIKGKFRDEFPNIFVDINAPEDLKKAFYKNMITPEYIFEHPGFIKYLINKDLSTLIKAKMNLSIPGLTNSEGQTVPSTLNFVDEYTSRYGNEKLLKLCARYGKFLSDITISSLHGEIEDEQQIEHSIRVDIFKKILKGNMDYSFLSNIPEMVDEHPEIFINLDSLTNISLEEKQRLTHAFYTSSLTFEDIKIYPELATILKTKNLSIAFKPSDGRFIVNSGYGYSLNEQNNNWKIIKVLGNENFLKLCIDYGKYLKCVSFEIEKNPDFFHNNNYEELILKIEETITNEIMSGNLRYNPDDAPLFLLAKHPELFLNDDAPQELKNYFYGVNRNYKITFQVLKEHKEWAPYLKNKTLIPSLLKSKYPKRDIMKYFELFGEDRGIKLGINRAETVQEMIKAHQVDLMKNWYDKTGGKFIPDFVVMQNFSLEEADKFLISGSNWSSLMRIQSFAKTPEARDAMLKLAYSFGAFDQDQRGFKKLQDLLTCLPKKIDADKGYIFDRIDFVIDRYSHRRVFFDIPYFNTESANMTKEEKEFAYDKIIDYFKNNPFNDFIGTDTLVNFLESLKKEKVDIDFYKPIFTQLYRINDDGSYTLTINTQSYPKSAAAIRNILSEFRELPILTPNKAHQLFGGFELKYDVDFREFLLSNLNEIIENPEYVSLISSIQKQFSEIKALNSNRVLTLELAVSFVQTNKYTSVNVGNEKVAEISAIAGYSQTDFDTLQQIYNYGKQRTFSSIPRIEQSAKKASGNYTYETLRVDDPLAMAIGTLTDCCQELNNCAEVCMEHSMVDKNGRVFIIRDEQGNIVAQSWVWRNKDVLCFDNIEIPDKAFARTIKAHPDLDRKGFTDEIFEIYKQAAHDLIEEDEKVYKQLLESEKITKDQYDGLKLGKVTVGLGYNDIAESLKQNAQVDKGTVSRPLPFYEPVKLSRGLYTSDSTTQYILEEREDRKEYNGDTLPVHSDTYIEYNDDNFNAKNLLSLEKLEIVTKENPRYLETSVNDNADFEHLVTEIAKNYELNPETTRIIMNPNFAIIYDINNNKITIGDLLFNTKVDNNEQQMDIEKSVVMQIRLALEQITGDNEIDISNLNEKQMDMYKKAIGLTDEMDIERGIFHAK